MRTLMDGGPLATSLFVSTERHQESLRSASRAQFRGDTAKGDARGSILASARQRGNGFVSGVAVRLRVMRQQPAQRGPAPEPVTAPMP